MGHGSHVGRLASREPYRRFGPVEGLIVLAAALVIVALLTFTRQNVATFQRSVPYAGVVQEIQLNIVKSQQALFEAAAGDSGVDLEAGVFGNLKLAAADCQALVSGGVTRVGTIAPLDDAAEREGAVLLCRQLEAFRVLTVAVVNNPQENGEATRFDEKYDRAHEDLLERTQGLYATFQRDLKREVSGVSSLGVTLAAACLLMAAGFVLLVSRQRRLAWVKARQLANLASIVEASVDAIVGNTVDGVISSWNPGAERLYGYSPAEIVGRHVDVLVPAERREDESALMARVRRGEQVLRYETDRVRKDGSRVPVALTMSPIFEEDRVHAISSISQDISEPKARDAALRTAREEALQAREEALQSSRLKSEFLSTMSHEIRTPMNGVIGLTNLLLETPLNATQRQYAEGVADSGEALLAVINDILDLSKLEAGKVTLELAEFDPRRMVEDVANLLALEAHGKQLELVAYCHPELSPLLIGDAGRLRQILLNLASNAVKFTATGEVAISARSTSDAAGNPVTRFEVVDTGIGIAAAARPLMFQSFSQADPSTTRRYGGTGLGLAISRKLTEAMSGEIGVDSEVGVGSTFWVQVPLPAPDHTLASGAPWSDHVLSDVRVLVVDDNATNRLVLKSQLAAWGMRPDVLEYPHLALAQMRDAAMKGHPYAITVLDMCMPDMDGLELARLISSEPALASTRLLVLTSTMQVDAGELQLAGVAHWMTKPVRNSELYNQLLKLVSGPGQVAPAPQEHASRLASAPRGRVLVAEDNALNQLVAEGVVSKLGYQVDIVANGIEALEAIATTHYAVVLMDCHMPVMDGFAATREIRRRQAAGDHVPIIAMTAGAMAEDRDRCLAAGMDDYLSKPVNVADMRVALARWVQELPTSEMVPTGAGQRNATAVTTAGSRN